ncbi:MAG: 2-oxo acid dehydrogenase subunit E2 [SAR324 cluster bacterium]|nr:2-oxo acid dehydrogenase subunit E2 [SAR324 cluster bacterium]
MKDFILPDIGEGIIECEVVEWLVKEGDLVKEDQMIVEIMTDKAVVQIPASDSGRMSKFYHQEGDIAKVHEPLFAVEIETEQEKIVENQDRSDPDFEASVKENFRSSDESESALLSAENSSPKALATPAVRRIGRELQIDLSDVSGSGKNGRILKEDLENYKNPEAQGKSELRNKGRVEPIKGIRLTMARKMTEAASTIPHFSFGDEIDLTRLADLREQLKGELTNSGVHLTLMSFFMKALALALRKYPILNSRLNPEVTEIIFQDSCHIGMAVDTPNGLMVPNVKNVQSLSLLEIAREVQRLSQNAREGKVDQVDMQGGTITLSNIGSIGGTFGIPIINPPEVAVVALGKIQTLPRFDQGGGIEARKLMQANWSADHRIIDGGTIARFSNLWKQYLEDPSLMLIYLR